jgi:hypothetical protein
MTGKKLSPAVQARFDRYAARQVASGRVLNLRAVLFAKYPAEFEHGYRSAYTAEFQKPCDAAGYPPGFHISVQEANNAWFAGWNIGNVERDGDDG